MDFLLNNNNNNNNNNTLVNNNTVITLVNIPKHTLQPVVQNYG